VGGLVPASPGPAPTRITLADVAAAARVATSTASDALNQRGRMAESTRERVHQKARELGYLPNPSARGLRVGSSRLIGVALRMHLDAPDMYPRDLYYSQLITATSTSAVDRGYAVALLPAHDLDVAGDLPLAGLIVTDSDVVSETVERAYALGVPVITDLREGDNRAAAVVDVDFPRAIALANDHLAANGAQRIGLIAFAPRDTYFAHNWERHHALWCAETRNDCIIRRAGSGDIKELALAVNELVQAGCDGIVLLPTGAGPEVLKILNDMGKQVPDDVLVLAVDEDPTLAATRPSLTTISLDPIRSATEGMDLVIDVIEGKVPLPASFFVPPILLPAETTIRR